MIPYITQKNDLMQNVREGLPKTACRKGGPDNERTSDHGRCFQGQLPLAAVFGEWKTVKKTKGAARHHGRFQPIDGNC